MSGPGEYRPDATEGIIRPEDLPKAKVVRQSRNFKHRPCPRCGKSCYRDKTFTRTLHDVGEQNGTAYLVMQYLAKPGDKRPIVDALMTNRFVGSVKFSADEFDEAQKNSREFRAYVT